MTALPRRIHRRRGNNIHRINNGDGDSKKIQKWSTSLVLYAIMATLASATLLFSTIIFFEFKRDSNNIDVDGHFFNGFVIPSNVTNANNLLRNTVSYTNHDTDPFDAFFSKYSNEQQNESSRVCLSPEKNVPWILNGQCLQHPFESSFSEGRSCGFCGDNPTISYFSKIRDQIAEKFQDKCSDLVVYGAALGQKYEEWLNDRDLMGNHNKMVTERHGTCFFQFVTTGTHFEGNLSVDGSQVLIPLDEKFLPYGNNRRNTKLLKLSPGLLFPWAKRIIWQDTKLLLVDDRNSVNVPSDYHRHFNRTVQRFGSCVSFMGMPQHPSAVGINRSVNLDAHCREIVRAATKRPTVSDNLHVLLAQCEEYQHKYENKMPGLFPLIDTAFIVWDMRREECRNFTGNLACSWLDEIHCYSDRDQVSFPSIIASSNLQISPHRQLNDLLELQDRVYVDSNGSPMVHIAKRSCHWYYRSFSRCVGSSEHEKYVTSDHEKKHSVKVNFSRTPPQPRVAIIVAGTLQRFMFRNVIDKLIRPLVKKSAKVDYYLSLTTSAGTPYRAGGGKTSYLNHIEKVDPRLVPVKATASEAVELPHHGNNTMWHPMAMEEFIRSQIARAGASIGELLIQEKIDIDSEPMLRARREKAMRKHPEEDADLRFPIFDIRSKEIENRTANANRNLLRLHLAVERLWASLVKWEDEEGFEYDYVLFLRDDSLWLSKFDLSAFESIASEEKDVDIFIPSCDAREPPMDSHELNDHAIISRRRSADVFGRYYSILLNGHHDHDRDREWNMYRKKKMEWKEEDSRNKNEDHIGDDNHVVDIVDACMSTLPITMTTSPRKRAVGIASSSSSSSSSPFTNASAR
mmetsp:Transcript_16245/g.30727  ORF Transcript_16245/g.30727 Transcript_16245/m.30727 type:complete len:854 (-) Transcript_16245:1090-3651(-)